MAWLTRPGEGIGRDNLRCLRREQLRRHAIELSHRACGRTLGKRLYEQFGRAPYGSYDTPSLYINNNTAYSFTDVQIVLKAYQGLNDGSTTTVPAVQLNGGVIPADTVY
jgi:hypothetical protein